MNEFREIINNSNEFSFYCVDCDTKLFSFSLTINKIEIFDNAVFLVLDDESSDIRIDINSIKEINKRQGTYGPVFSFIGENGVAIEVSKIN